MFSWRSTYFYDKGSKCFYNSDLSYLMQVEISVMRDIFNETKIYINANEEVLL